MGTTFNSTMAPTKKQGQAAWFTELSPPERSTFIATFGGWALDGMDVMVYSFVIPSLIAAWYITRGQAGMLGTAALLISAVGGWLAGLLADRFGRTRVLQWTILWFALFTFLSGFTNNFWQLLMTRGCQGLGFGGEWAVGSVLMGERFAPSTGAKPWAPCRVAGPSAGELPRYARSRCSHGFPQASLGAPCSGLASCRRCWSSTFGATFPSLRFTPERAKISPPEATNLISSRSFLRRY